MSVKLHQYKMLFKKKGKFDMITSLILSYFYMNIFYSFVPLVNIAWGCKVFTNLLSTNVYLCLTCISFAFLAPSTMLATMLGITQVPSLICQLTTCVQLHKCENDFRPM